MTIWTPNDNGYADLTSHDTFVAGAPHNTFKRLRDEDPIHWTDWANGKGFWSITRHADIMEMNRNTAVFSSEHGIRMEDQSPEEVIARRTFQEIDPPEHMKTRIKLAKAFSKGVIEGFNSDIRELCVNILDDVLPEGEFDATKRIARVLPMLMLGRIIGTPEEDLPWLVQKGDELIANTDPDFTDHVLDKITTDEFRMMPFNSPAGAELFAYAKEMLERKKREGDTSGVLHMILQPGPDGEVISETEFRNFFCLLVAAGNDTTRYSIAAGIQALCHQPELLAQMQAGGDIWETAPDEIIRWATPALYFRRTALSDYEIHGKTIKAGDKVLYWFMSANRDETVFDDPFRVNLFRTPNKHLSFGQGGPHLCLGMWLARLEVRVLFQELSKRIRHIEAAGPQQFLRSNFVGGLKSLPVRVTLN
ncbi:cytochrome P450 [Sulfitobacter sp. 20_GPM-1509m]|jgi:cytochrome P450|uniref:cytochrome P450 n=1 Tax=Sulfitobacter sp. 20_GPM-1509m TaxID=1380367 RepID=UPI0004920B24|nr:cytochrome P450 [Sulfitobacter sp. 20_GPM-1509m]|tara:strand:+ start:919 stop:2178 length:1260 start_codon:yes stop_codon:yes gene_type:complete